MNSGRRRKERAGPESFSWQISRFEDLQKQLARQIQEGVDEVTLQGTRQELERRNVHVLLNHDYDKPLGSLLQGNARFKSDRDALTFEVDLPDTEDLMPSYMRDAVKQIENRLLGGVSPGFNFPPANVVRNGGKRIEVEPGTGVEVVVLENVILDHVGLVTRPAYSETSLDLRAEDFEQKEKRMRIWL